MSALKGGGAAKEADGFEERWTVNMLFDLLEESASQIELEPPGTTKGFEFSLQREGLREWHQVKYQNSKLGKWTLNGLEDEKVLTYFKNKLDSEADAHCLFFSCDSAFPLRLLWERSQMSETVERFLKNFLDGHEDEFDALRDKWGKVDAETAWSLLLRITTQNMDDASLRKSNRDRARCLVDADDPDDVVRLLYELIDERVHQRLDTEQVWGALGEKGWGPRAWRTDAAVLERVRGTTSQFLSRQEELLINSDFIAIDEVKQVIEQLQAPAPTAPVVVHGLPGCGKSTAMMKVIRHFSDQGWRVLTLDLGWIGGVASSEELGARLGLPGAPADVLGGIVKDQRALLVVDGLDRIAASLGSPQQLTAVLSDVLSTAGSHKRLAVLLSCRTTDLENDVRVQSAVSRSATTSTGLSSVGGHRSRSSRRCCEARSTPIGCARSRSNCSAFRRISSCWLRAATPVSLISRLSSICRLVTPVSRRSACERSLCRADRGALGRSFGARCDPRRAWLDRGPEPDQVSRRP